MSREFQEASDHLRDFMFKKVYIGSAAKKEETKAERMLRELFTWLMEHPEYLPADFRDSIEKEGLEQSVTDYVAGMTDRYAVRKFNEIFVPVSWLE